MDKEILRKKMLAKRLAMSPTEVKVKSHTICQLLLKNVDWPAITSVHIYKSRTDWREVDTGELIEHLNQTWPQLKISQPGNQHREPIPKNKFDLVIVPTLAFDNNGNRLGWGGGWYDKFLATQPQAIKIGLGFENGRLNKIPAEPHDIRLDQIITEA